MPSYLHRYLPTYVHDTATAVHVYLDNEMFTSMDSNYGVEQTRSDSGCPSWRSVGGQVGP